MILCLHPRQHMGVGIFVFTHFTGETIYGLSCATLHLLSGSVRSRIGFLQPISDHKREAAFRIENMSTKTESGKQLIRLIPVWKVRSKNFVRCPAKGKNSVLKIMLWSSMWSMEWSLQKSLHWIQVMRLAIGICIHIILTLSKFGYHSFHQFRIDQALLIVQLFHLSH